MKALNGMFSWLFITIQCFTSTATATDTYNDIGRCTELENQIKDNLLLEVQNQTSTLDSALQNTTNWNIPLDKIMNIVENTLQDTSTINNINPMCFKLIFFNLHSKFNNELGTVAYLINKKDGLIDLYSYKIPSVEVSKLLLKTGADLKARNSGDETALHVAAGSGYLNVVQWLVNEKNMNVSESTKYLGNSLHYATELCHLNVVKWLIDNTDVNINQFNKYGCTVLYNSHSCINVTKYLILDVKMDYNFRCIKNQTFLYKAAREGNLELVKWLVEDLKMDMNAQENEGYTILHLAYHHPDIVEYLIQQGADYNLTSIYKETILHYPVVRQNTATIKVILENCKLDVNLQDTNGSTVLHKGTELIEIVTMLVEIGKIDVNIKEFVRNQTALHVACNKGHLASVQYLVENTTADVNVIDNDGNSLLHVATKYLKVVKYLINKVDFNIKNNAGQNVLEKAKFDYNATDYYLWQGMHKGVYEWLENNVNFTTKVDSN